MNDKSKEVVIIGAVRTPIGTYKGSLKNIKPDQLGSIVIKEVLKKSKFNKDEIDEVIMGQVLTAGGGQNPARQAAIKCGLPKEKPAYLVNQVCGSGLRSIASGFQSMQFRVIENALGLKNDDRIKFSKQKYTAYLSKSESELAEKYENSKSIFDLVESWLERTPFIESEEFNFWQSYKESIKNMLDSDIEIINQNSNLDDNAKAEQIENYKNIYQNYDSLFDSNQYEKLLKSGAKRLSQKASLAALFIMLYRDEPILQAPFKLLTKLIDIDQSLKTPQFYLLWTNLFCNVSAGIGVLGVAKTMMGDIFSTSMPSIVDTAFAATYVSMISVANMSGRFFWASTSDFVGRKNTFNIFFGLGIPLYMSIPYIADMTNSTDSIAPLILFYGTTMCIFTMYGGGFATVCFYL